MADATRVLVTGAARGIGLAVARAFHIAGARLAMLDVNEDALATAAGALGERAVPIVADLRRPDLAREALRRGVEALGGLDVAVVNAGVYPSCPALELTVEAWDDVMAVNATGAYITCQEAARAMVEGGRGGCIVTMASGSARFAREGAAHYCASKAAVVMLTRVLALELARHRIRVNAVSPGLVEVPEGPPLNPAYKRAMTAGIPWGRAGTPEDVAAAVVALCDPKLEYVTGQVLTVDGGLSAGRFGLPTSAIQGEEHA